MKRRQGKGAPSADLLVCFPTRAHLTLMPKPICSPARQSDSNRHNSHLKKVRNRGSGASSGGHGSPVLWAKPKTADISEPTSPKVTCAGQIKVRSKPNSCKNWQSVMEEIENLHKNRTNKKKLSWVESLGFKKDVMQFLTCLRRIRFDFRCFGNFPNSEITSDDEEEDEEEEDEDYELNPQVGVDKNESSRTVFSKWFMVLQENQTSGLAKEAEAPSPCAPPPNALLLMRCRSAPAKSWLEERAEEEEEEEEEEDHDEEEEERNRILAMEEEKSREKKQSMVVMRYDTDLHKISTDIAKETWVVGGIKDPLSRSRSWKR